MYQFDNTNVDLVRDMEALTCLLLLDTKIQVLGEYRADH